jgi:hypothetical protein
METPQNTQLFVWRGQIKWDESVGAPAGALKKRDLIDELPYLADDYESKCPFCDHTYPPNTCRRDAGNMATTDATCQLCGFNYGDSWCEGMTFLERCGHVSFLKPMSVNCPELRLDELGTHLKRRYRDIYSIAPRTLERLVEDVYRNLGYATRLTPQARDGGFDVLLESAAGEQVLVEVKRYSEDRSVGIDIVRQLLGVQLDLGVRKAKIVTSTRFTRPARELAAKSGVALGGYWVDLVDADELVRALGIYKLALPPLHLIDDLKSLP